MTIIASYVGTGQIFYHNHSRHLHATAFCCIIRTIFFSAKGYLMSYGTFQNYNIIATFQEVPADWDHPALQ